MVRTWRLGSLARVLIILAVTDGNSRVSLQLGKIVDIIVRWAWLHEGFLESLVSSHDHSRGTGLGRLEYRV